MLIGSKILKLSLYNTESVYFFYKIDKEKDYTYLKIKNIITTNFYEIVEKISKYLYFDVFNDNFKNSLKNEEFKLLYNELKMNQNIIVKDGVIFAKSHFDLAKNTNLFKQDNLLIVIPENIINENNINKIQFLKWNNLDKWWAIQNKKIFLEKPSFKPIEENQLNKRYVL